MIGESEYHGLLQLLSLQENRKFAVILLHGKLVRRIAGAHGVTRLNVCFNLNPEGVENLRKRAGRTLRYPVELRRAIPSFAVVFFAIRRFAIIVVQRSSTPSRCWTVDRRR